MKINNNKTEVKNGICLNEKDYLNILLTNLKCIEKNYVIFLTESSNKYLYKEIKTQFDILCKMQRDVYSVMFQKGWYELEIVDTQKVKNSYNTLSNDFSSLSS